MAKTLAKVLKTDISRLPLRKAAEELRKKGRGRDTILAHITPREAAKLKAEGGSGTINPDTGLPEFEDGFDFGMPTFEFFGGYGPGAEYQPQDTGITADIPTPMARPSDVEFAQYNPQTYQDFARVGEYPTSVLSNIMPGVSQGMAASYGGGDYGADNLLAATQLAARGYGNIPEQVQALYSGGAPTPPVIPADIAAARQAATEIVPFEGEAAAYRASGGLDPEVEKRITEEKTAAAAKGIQTPFGTLGTKELIAALGLGGLGLNYLRSQQQGKQAAQQLQNAYNQAAAQTRELAQPYMQQGGAQLGQALTGALSPAQQQQLAAAQAQAAQSTASSGGVAAAQAGRSVEDLRQRLLANQQTMALQLLGTGTPLISQAIRDQLAGTTTGINTNMQLSQQAGTAASGMLAMLGAMYARG
jgi:hypothetical protein